MRRLAENEVPIAVSEYIDEDINRWKMEQVKFAITGRSATGKSTFINTIRNLKPGDYDFAKAGSGETTITPKLYMHPTAGQIVFYELPDYSSTTIEKENYMIEMRIYHYDFVFVIFNNILSEDDIWLAGELSKLGKPFSLVRSKIDLDLDNAIYDGNDQEMVIPEIKASIISALNANHVLNETEGIFLISSRYPDLGEMSDLIMYVEKNIDGFKAQAFLFSISSITKKIVERKHKMLKKRLVRAIALAAGIAAIPVPVVDVAVHIALLAHEVSYYMRVFGVERESVYSLRDFDHSLLKCKSLLGPHFKVIHSVGKTIGTYGALYIMIVKYLFNWFIPMAGSILSSAITAVVTYIFLHNMLQDIKDDAVLLHEHIMKTNADKRMSKMNTK